MTIIDLLILMIVVLFLSTEVELDFLEVLGVVAMYLVIRMLVMFTLAL